jgi:hypothetical protein
VAVAGAVVTSLLSGLIGIRIVLGAVAFAGLCLVAGAMNGKRLLRQATSESSQASRSMELFTYPYRSIKAITNNAVLATLDELGSTERTPPVEFKARWFTPGIGEAPSSRADMFGDSKKGQVVLAVIENGGVLGRVHRIRPKS